MKSKADKLFGLPQFVTRMVGDLIAVLGAWFLSYFLRFFVLPGAHRDSWKLFSVLSVLACVSSLYFLNRNKLYEVDVSNTWRKEMSALLKTSFEVFLTFVFVYYFIFPKKISRLALLLFFVFHFIFLAIMRTLIGKYFLHAYKRGRFVRHILLVGYGKNLEEYYEVATGTVQGLKIVGQYWGKGHGIGEVPSVVASSLAEVVQTTKADLVIISFPLDDNESEQQMVKEGLDLLDQRVLLLPHIPKSYVGTLISDFHFIPVLKINGIEMSFLKRMQKRIFDIVSCSLGILLLSPLFLIIPLLIKCTSKGPVLFKQKRVTRDGKVFNMFKFRSMRTEESEGDHPHWTEENDPRITKIGRILRKTSLDEIPQFLNVIGGSMSLIGPRPERPELEDEFKKTIPGYAMRHRMKAGISGWAQVNGLRGNTSLSKRIDFDLYYVRNWSVWFDLKIVMLTFFKGFVNKNAY